MLKKKLLICLLAGLVAVSLLACRHSSDNDDSSVIVPIQPVETVAVSLTINGSSLSLQLEDNETAVAFSQLLDITLTMSELNGNEKFVYLSGSLPSDPQAAITIEAGDLMLYGNNCLVLFYQSFSTSYSYTKIGRLIDCPDLAKTVGSGSIIALFSAS